MSSRQSLGPGASAARGQASAESKHSASAGKALSAISSLVTLEDVQKNPAELISKIAGDVLAKSQGAPRQPGQATLQPMVQLLERFERCDKELAKLQQQVDMRAERLRREVGQEEAEYQAQVAGLEVQWASIRGSFQELEGRMNSVTQAATKIGNRLQNADLYRKRALEAIDKINCLQEFAHAKDPTDLPPLFHDNTRLAEAASMTGKLLAVAQELLSSRDRVGLGAMAAAEASQQPNASTSASGTLEVGTLENAVEQLELYRNLLDNRVVSRFDAALGRQDLPALADCVRTMAEFSRGEAILVQRYISTRPIFTGALKEQQLVEQQQVVAAAAAAAAAAAGGGGGGGGGPSGAAAAAEAAEAAAAADLAALRALSSLYRSILSTLRDDAVVIEQVFPSPYRALAQYIQRVFEQKVQTAVDAVLLPGPPTGAGPAVLRARLRHMADVYKKTRALADDLQGLVGEELSVREVADSVVGEALAGYLQLEMRWLQAAQQEREAAHRGAGGGLSMAVVLDMLTTNEEAATRCALLSPAAQVAPAVRQLFHSSTPKQANTACLLEQVASHMLQGLGQALDRCTQALLGPFRPQQVLDQAAAASSQAAATSSAPGGSGNGGVGSGSGSGASFSSGPQPAAQRGSEPGATAAAGGGAGGAATALAPGGTSLPRQLSRRTLEQAAALSVGRSLGRVLEAVTTIGAMLRVLQQHFLHALLPHLADSPGETQACQSGMGALVRVVDERVLGALQRCLALLLNQADATLVAEQQRPDFAPNEADLSPSLDTPTPACAAVCALLAAAQEAAEHHLHGPNLASMLAELGRRACLMLDAHQQRFSFTPLGALRWKRDLAEYGAVLAAPRQQAPAVRQHLEDMQAHVNMLIVAPDSLLSLVDGNLHIPHRNALSVIALRSDFRTARVGEGGASLAALFSSE